MAVERNLLMSLLKLTKDGPALFKCVKADTKTSWNATKELLEKLQKEEMVYMRHDTVEADGYSRLRLAIKVISLGADVQDVSDLLRWQEFEDLAAVVLERNGYNVEKNMHFKHAGRKWEIDAIGYRKPLVICIDCKHWRHGMSPSALTKIAEAQVERTLALSESLPNISIELECAKWDKAKFVPVVLVLIPSGFKFYDKVPIVPIFQLQDFLSQLPVHLELLKYLSKEFNHLSHDF